MYEFMQNKPYVMVNSTREGVEYVRDSEGRYAFFLEAALNDYYNGRYPCDTMMVGKNLDYKGKYYFKPWYSEQVRQTLFVHFIGAILNNSLYQMEYA